MILHAELVPDRIQYRLLVYSCVWNCDIYPTRSTRCVSPVERTQLCPYHSSTYRYLSSTKFRIDLNLVRPKFRIKFSMILDLLLVSDHSLAVVTSGGVGNPPPFSCCWLHRPDQPRPRPEAPALVRPCTRAYGCPRESSPRVELIVA